MIEVRGGGLRKEGDECFCYILLYNAYYNRGFFRKSGRVGGMFVGVFFVFLLIVCYKTVCKTSTCFELKEKKYANLKWQELR